MLFMHTLDKVLSGEKTQTSRLWKDNWDMGYLPPISIADGYPFDAVYSYSTLHMERDTQGNEWYGTPDYKLKHYVGQRLAIQPARGKKSVGRIEITSLAKRDVRGFTSKDFEREGFTSALADFDFFFIWLKMHDKPSLTAMIKQGLWNVHKRPAHLYTALVINFKLIEVYSHDKDYRYNELMTWLMK